MTQVCSPISPSQPLSLGAIRQNGVSKEVLVTTGDAAFLLTPVTAKGAIFAAWADEP